TGAQHERIFELKNPGFEYQSPMVIGSGVGGGWISPHRMCEVKTHIHGETTKDCRFHAWGYDGEDFGSVAIIEDKDGFVSKVSPDHIRFTDRDADETL
ncbi:unnamed protein product, partial [marine sediment metagenome]